MENRNLQIAIEKFLGIMKGDSQFITLSRSKSGITTWKIKMSAITDERELLLRKLLAVDRIMLNYFYGKKLAVNDVALSDPTITEGSTITVAIERGVKGGLAYDIFISGGVSDGILIPDEIKSIEEEINERFDSEAVRATRKTGVMFV